MAVLVPASLGVVRRGGGSGRSRTLRRPVAVGLAGRRADAERMHAELVSRASLSHVSPISLSLTPLLLGRVEEAVAFFQQAFDQRDPVLVTTTAWPLFSRVRKEPAVQRLFEQMGVRWTP